MHPDWHEFLQQQGALFNVGPITHFADSRAPADPSGSAVVLADLSGLQGLIEITGPERRAFLQGQLSTDIRRLTADLSQPSSWNNARGRVVATLRIFERDDAVMLALPHALAATVSARLRLYVLRSKVQITEASDKLARFGVVGNEAPRLLADCGYPTPEKANSITSSNGIQIIRLHGATPRVAVHGEAPALQALWTGLQHHGAHPAGSDTWTLHRILAGEPCVHPATSGHFVAQMLGLEKLGAVHFNKGCYLGQEVIARAHYRGAVKRHLQRASCRTADALLPGAEITDSTHQAAVGEVVDACRDANNLWQILIVLQDDSKHAPLRVNHAPVSLISKGAITQPDDS